jgi:hypothetical protein
MSEWREADWMRDGESTTTDNPRLVWLPDNKFINEPRLLCVPPCVYVHVPCEAIPQTNEPTLSLFPCPTISTVTKSLFYLEFPNRRDKKAHLKVGHKAGKTFTCIKFVSASGKSWTSSWMNKSRLNKKEWDKRGASILSPLSVSLCNFLCKLIHSRDKMRGKVHHPFFRNRAATFIDDFVMTCHKG